MARPGNFAAIAPGAAPRSTRPARSIVPTAAASPSPSSAAESSRSTAATTRRRPMATSAARCARFDRRVYGDERLLHPAVRERPEGLAAHSRASTWDEALDLDRDEDARGDATRFGAEAVLPYYYGGSNGLLTNDLEDARFFRRLGASRLARTRLRRADRRRRHGDVRQDGGRRVSGLRRRAADRRLGLQSVGVRHPPRRRTSRRRRRTARSSSSSIRAARRSRARPISICRCGPGTDLPVALAVIRELFERGCADSSRSSPRTPTGVDELPAGRRRVDDRSRGRGEPASTASDLATFAEWYGTTSPAVIRCGWGQERNRNGGSADDGHPRAAGGRRQVRRPGRRLHDEQLRRLGHQRPNS